MKGPATVYLLCFAKTPLAHARHYLGMTQLSVEDRQRAHRGILRPDGSSYGRPAKILSALLAAGGDWVLADTWECTSKSEALAFERRLKKQGGGSRCCSICRPGNGRGVGRGRNRYGMVDSAANGHPAVPPQPPCVAPPYETSTTIGKERKSTATGPPVSPR